MGSLVGAAPAWELLIAGNFVDAALRESSLRSSQEIQGASAGPGRHASLFVKVSMYI